MNVVASMSDWIRQPPGSTQSTVPSDHSGDGHADQRVRRPARVRSRDLPSVAGFGAVNPAVTADWLFHMVVGSGLIWTRLSRNPLSVRHAVCGITI
jgi:hypothetical protein